jgi:hypothetical protein
MYRHLLLAVTLGAVAMLPAPASADGHAPAHPNVVSSLDFRIVLQDRPTFVHHRHPPRGYLRSQPWPSKFKHHAPRPRWHEPRHHRTRHFWSRDNDHRSYFKHGHNKGWVHGAARNPGRHDGFKNRHHRSGSHD